ncbi:MAG: quinone-dependent dihydroorotate dehydrogenase [Chloroflexota bacterium]
MSIYARLVYPLISVVDAEVTHNVTINLLENTQNSGSGRSFLGRIAGDLPPSKCTVAGLTFPNVLGVAAGFDKDVRVAKGLAQLGFGHVEVGTLTPRPQEGNPRPRIFRYKQQGALINRMGFPNCGVRAALPRLRTLAESPREWVLGVSLGKQKETPLAEAVDDYIEVMQLVYENTDYLAVNISSPNTPGLRELQRGSYITNLLNQLKLESIRLAQEKGVKERPIFVKIAPDIDQEGLLEVIDAAFGQEIDGIIATNTTRSREQLPSAAADQEGGMSGKPLFEKSIKVVRDISSITSGKMAIIGVGGVRTAEDVGKMLDAGASLVQVYTGMIYDGPGIAGRILRQL